MKLSEKFNELYIRVILAIVHIFEASKPFGDFSAVAVLDDGAGISYGMNQFTHKSGSLGLVVHGHRLSDKILGIVTTLDAQPFILKGSPKEAEPTRQEAIEVLAEPESLELPSQALSENSLLTDFSDDSSELEEARASDQNAVVTGFGEEWVENLGAGLNSVDDEVQEIFEKSENATGQIKESVTETAEEGGAMIQKTITDITDKFSPKNIPAFLPNFGVKNWLLSLFPAGGIFATLGAYFNDAPMWFVFVLGVLTGILLAILGGVILNFVKFKSNVILRCYDSLANPNANNLIPTPTPSRLFRNEGYRREGIELAVKDKVVTEKPKIVFNYAEPNQ